MDRKENFLAEAISAGEYRKAAEFVREGQRDSAKTVLDEIFFFQNLHRHASGFPLIEALAEKGLVELDFYEYKAIETSIMGDIINVLKRDSSPENLKGLKSILQKADNIDEPVQGKNLMAYAIEQNVPPAVLEALTEAGCDSRFINDLGENYLHIIISRSSHISRREKQSHIERYLDFFINQGLDINATDDRGLTPLLKAVSSPGGRPSEILEGLLERGADVCAETRERKTALELAIERNDYESCCVLQQYGAVPNGEKRDEKQQSGVYIFLSTAPYSLSDTHRQIFQLFLRAGFDPRQMNKSLYHAEETPLDVILQKAPEYLEQLLDYIPLDLGTPDQRGDTPLHKVCAFNVNYEELKAKDVYRKVKLLIKAGADPSLQNNQGKTARDLASLDERKYISVEYLLKQEMKTD